MDQRHSPDRYNRSPAYQLQDAPYRHDEPLEIPVGPGPYAQHSTDRLAAQPTYEVTNMPGTYGHNQQYDDAHEHGYTPNPFQQAAHQGRGEYNLSPRYEHDDSWR
jgi:chitin synthase